MNVRALIFVAATIIIVWSAALSAHAQILLEVNDSDPSNITFTGTLVAPSASDSSQSFFNGIDLAGFFTSNWTGDPSVIIPLTGNGLMPVTSIGDPEHYNTIFVDYLTDPMPRVLNFFSGYDSYQDFETGSPALTGTATLDLTGYSQLVDLLPSAGTTGVLYAGVSFSSPVAIGYWEVVGAASAPEPSTYMLLLMGGIFLGFLMRHRLAKAGSASQGQVS